MRGWGGPTGRIWSGFGKRLVRNSVGSRIRFVIVFSILHPIIRSSVRPSVCPSVRQTVNPSVRLTYLRTSDAGDMHLKQISSTFLVDARPRRSSTTCTDRFSTKSKFNFVFRRFELHQFCFFVKTVELNRIISTSLQGTRGRSTQGKSSMLFIFSITVKLLKFHQEGKQTIPANHQCQDISFTRSNVYNFTVCGNFVTTGS